jgi:hypothetical protein
MYLKDFKLYLDVVLNETKQWNAYSIMDIQSSDTGCPRGYEEVKGFFMGTHDYC